MLFKFSSRMSLFSGMALSLENYYFIYLKKNRNFFKIPLCIEIVTFSEKRKEHKRQEPQPIIQTAKASETFFADVRKRPLIGGGGQLIKSQMPMQMQVPMMPMLNPMVSMQMPAFSAQNRMFPARQSQEKMKPAPTNVPSGKVYSKKEKEELENRRHGAELRQVRTRN